jgi:adenylyltransferase/sulfurtransferase
MQDTELLRYSRHILLPEIGIEGQEKIRAARVLIVGVGGLGSPAALYLAAAGVGTLVLADGDEVELSNLQRQVLHELSAIGQPKAESARQTLARINPDVTLVPITARLEGDALETQVAKADVVLDCTDNFASRHAINRACVKHRKPLVSGAAIRFQGQLAVFDLRCATNACYHCLFPEAEDHDAPRCAVTGVFSPLTGIIGSLQAAEALKILGGFGLSSNGRLWLFNAARLDWREVGFAIDPYCLVCRHADHDFF